MQADARVAGMRQQAPQKRLAPLVIERVPVEEDGRVFSGGHAVAQHQENQGHPALVGLLLEPELIHFIVRDIDCDFHCATPDRTAVCRPCDGDAHCSPSLYQESAQPRLEPDTAFQEIEQPVPPATGRCIAPGNMRAFLGGSMARRWGRRAGRRGRRGTGRLPLSGRPDILSLRQIPCPSTALKRTAR